MLLAHWKCNDVSGQGVVLDAMGRSNGTHKTAGAGSDLTSSTGVINTAIVFGDTKWADMGDISSIGTIKTIAFWADFSAAGAMDVIRLDGETHKITRSGGAGRVFGVVGFPGTEIFYINATVVTTEKMAENVFQFYVVTTTTGISPANFSIRDETATAITVDFDNIMLFDRVLSLEEVKFLYNSGIGFEDIKAVIGERYFRSRYSSFGGHRSRYNRAG